MEKLSMCRICLLEDSDDTRLRLIVNTYFQEIYESLTSTPFVTEDHRPIQVCYLCCEKLDICYELKRRCLESETTFTQMLGCHVGVKLQISPNTHQSLGDVKQMTPEVFDDDVKQEVAEDSDHDTELHSIIKVEYDEIPTFETDPLEEDDHFQSSPVEDDLSFTENGDVTANSEDDTEVRSIIKVEDDKIPSDLVPGTARRVTQENYETISLSSLKKTDPAKDKIEKPGIKTKQSDKDKPTEQHQMVETRDAMDSKLQKYKKKSNITSDHSLVDEQSGNEVFIDRIIHIHVHTADKPHNCNICKRKFSNKSNLIRHIRTHTGEKPFQCNICNKGFSENGKLDIHMRTHTGVKPFNCNICEKSFTVKNNLLRHVRTHTGEKPYICNICQKSFTQRGNLMSHVRNHTGEKPFICNICKKAFKEKSNLESHLFVHRFL